MKTNSKQVRDAIKQHILNCVTDGEGNNYNNLKEACNRLKSEFERVANYPLNLSNIPNDQNRFSDYLCSIPFNFEYDNESIQNFLNSLGTNPTGKEYDYDKSMRLYHYLIFS
jgi:hypothetical protein